MSNRAYSFLTVKSVDEDARTIEGIATTPTADRAGDIVEPKGAEFKLPIPFLWQHDSRKPIGHVIAAKVGPTGITVKIQLAKIDEPGTLKDRLDEAWQSIKHGLVQGLSIGFSAVESARIEGTYSQRFMKWLWLELSAVTIPANGEATITAIKSIDHALLAASGHKQVPVVRLDNPPGVAGEIKTKTLLQTPATGKENTMKPIAEQIAEYENTKATKLARQDAIMTGAAEKGETLDTAASEEYDTLENEVKSIDAHVSRLRAHAARTVAKTAPVGEVRSVEAGAAARTTVQVKAQPKLEPGINFARLVKVKALAGKLNMQAGEVAERHYGADSDIAGVFKAAVGAGSSLSGNWAYDLVSQEGGVAADFAAFLRPSTILGKFGQNGVPNLKEVPFRTPLIVQTGGGAGYWVGQGKPKPLTAFDFDRSIIDELKVANICVLTEESIRASSPKSDTLVRDSLRDALVARLDTDFIDPTKTASAGVSPASITNGAATIASTGTDEAAIRRDIRAVFQKFILADNPPDEGVWIMSPTNALSASMMVNALGQKEFPGITMMGGTLEGLPVIVSRYAGSIIALVNASDVYLADEGGVNVDMSREASLEMLDGSLQQDALAGTGASLVSMFQTNSVAIRAERVINWKRRRLSGVAYLTNAQWGGGIPNS